MGDRLEHRVAELSRLLVTYRGIALALESAADGDVVTVDMPVGSSTFETVEVDVGALQGEVFSVNIGCGVCVHMSLEEAIATVETLVKEGTARLREARQAAEARAKEAGKVRNVTVGGPPQRRAR
jgi:prefoldin subunit 5